MNLERLKKCTAKQKEAQILLGLLQRSCQNSWYTACRQHHELRENEEMYGKTEISTDTS